MRRSWRVGLGAGSAIVTDRFVVEYVSDSIWAAHRVSGFAARCGMRARARAELAIVASELVTNAVKFAGGGTLSIERTLQPHGVMLVVEDDGPGIDDPEAALMDGYSEGRMLTADMDLRGRRGLGSGLAAVKRLSDSVSIEESATGGARVVVRKWIVGA